MFLLGAAINIFYEIISWGAAQICKNTDMFRGTAISTRHM